MPSPLVVGIASVIPGLGFVLLNKFRWAVNAFVLVVGLFVVGLFISSEFWSSFLIQFSALAWIGQIVYAVQTANRQKKKEAGELISPREAMPLPPAPPNLSRGEKLAFKIAETLRQQLQPGEILKDAVLATIMPSKGQHMLSGAAAAFAIKQYYLGVTNLGLILLELDMLGKPFQVNRIPMDKIKSVEYKKKLLQDDLTVQVYGERPVQYLVNSLVRSHTENLANIFQPR